MHLSTAMMLGSTTCKMEAGNWNSCGIGCAGNAIGIPNTENPDDRLVPLFNAWPWLSDEWFVWVIFDTKVCAGKMTFDAYVDWVKSIEPSCGDCNEFVCKCVQKMDETPTLQLQEVTQ